MFGSNGSVFLFIFLAEVCVVTISTMRTIFVARGMKFLAPFLGMFEVSIWLFAIGEVMKNLNDWTCSAAFAGGFTLGNFLGILLEEKLAMGSVGVRMITHRDAGTLIDELRGRVRRHAHRRPGADRAGAGGLYGHQAQTTRQGVGDRPALRSASVLFGG